MSRRVCNGCGGYVGIDCFNPVECEWIANDQRRILREREIDYQINQTLEGSLQMEAMRKHFNFSMDALAVFLETESNRDVDTVSEFLEAARFAATQGRRYPVESLTEWLENETK